MRVEMLKQSGRFRKGDTPNLKDNEADILIKLGYAKRYTSPKYQTKVMEAAQLSEPVLEKPKKKAEKVEKLETDIEVTKVEKKIKTTSEE
jgi:hypothetical protein